MIIYVVKGDGLSHVLLRTVPLDGTFSLRLSLRCGEVGSAADRTQIINLFCVITVGLTAAAPLFNLFLLVIYVDGGLGTTREKVNGEAPETLRFRDAALIPRSLPRHFGCFLNCVKLPLKWPPFFHS